MKRHQLLHLLLSSSLKGRPSGVTLLLLFLVPLFTAAQISQTVRGTIFENYTETTLTGAHVYLFLPHDTLHVVSDAAGEFRFSNVPVGRFSLLARYAGYTEYLAQNLELNSSKELVLTIRLNEHVQSIDEVVINARKAGEVNNEMTSVSARSFSIEESQRYAGSLNDVARMAQNFAGVQGADDSRNDIIIRGNSPTGVLYRLEGIDIPNPNHFARFGTTGGPISMLNNNVLANSDFLTGAFPAEYGNALAGVFDLKMRNGNNEKYEFMAQIGFNGAEAMAEGPFSKKSKASFLISYRYSTLELFKLMGINFGTTATPKYQDLSFKLNFPAKRSRTQIFGIGGLSRVDLLAKELDPDNQVWGYVGQDVYFTSNSGLVGITHKRFLSENRTLEFLYSAQGAVNQVRSDTLTLALENPFTTFGSYSTSSKHTATIRFQQKINSRNVFECGIMNDLYLLNLNDSIYEPAIADFITIRSYKGSSVLIRPFVQHRFRINERTTLVGGVYSQLFSLSNQFALEPRLGLSFDLNSNQVLALGYGLHSQLAPLELYFKEVQQPDGSYAQPNRDLGFTRSHHLVFSYQKRFAKGIRIKSELYGQYLFDVPVNVTPNTYSLLNFGSSFITTFPDTLVNDGEGYNYGLELTIEKLLKNGFYFLVTASLYESHYRASDGKWYNSAFNGNHTLNVLGGYEFRFGKKDGKFQSALTLDAKVVWNGGARYTPILLAESQAMGTEIRDYTQTNQARYADYMKLNFRIGYKLIGRNITQEFALDLQNLTNRKNIFLQEYNPQAQQIRTTYQTGLLPIMQYRVYF